jgi:transcriptional regulator with XRE-family HTH domain
MGQPERNSHWFSERLKKEASGGVRLSLQTPTGESFSLTELESAYTNLGEDLLVNLDSDPDYRSAFVEEKIRSGLAAQIKTIREKMAMNQKDFASLLGRSQSWVSRLEDPNEPVPTIPTLLTVANKLDIGLKVCFVPFSELIDDLIGLSPDRLNVPKFRDDRRLFPRRGPQADTTMRFRSNVLTFNRDNLHNLRVDSIETGDTLYQADRFPLSEVVNG